MSVCVCISVCVSLTGRLMYPMDHQSVGPLGGSGGGGLGGSTPSWMLPNDPTAMMAQQVRATAVTLSVCWFFTISSVDRHA